MDIDRKSIFRFVSLQDLIAEKVITSDPDKLDSVIYFHNGGVLTKSDAILAIAKALGFPYSLLLIFKIIPRGLRNVLYDLVARNRYRLFGKQDACRIPDQDRRSRFIDSSLLPNFVAESKKNP